MKSWLIYPKDESVRNSFFVGKILELSERKGIETRLLFEENIEFFINSGKGMVLYDGVELPLPDFVINRSRNYLFARFLELLGVKVVNSALVSEVCNNKALTYGVASKLGIKMPDTLFSPSGVKSTFFPCVVKSCHGFGGKEVFLAENEEEFQESVSKLRHDDYVVQRLADKGKDVRVYTVGGKIIKAMLRYNPDSLTSNFCLGGQAREFCVTSEMENAVNKLYDYLGFDYAGVDFIFENGEPVFNEIEDVVGARMIYTHTDIDIIGIFFDYILSK